MRKFLVIIWMFTLVVTLFSCGPRVNVKGYFLDIEERTTSISFSVEIEDPNEEITGNVVAELVDVKTNTVITDELLDQSNQSNSVKFDGLDNKGDYRIDVRATMGRDSIVIISHDVNLQSLLTVTINTVEDFMAMGDNPEGNYVLGQDIDFSGHDFISPFENTKKTFSGTFDGNGFTLSNITFVSSSGNIGIFAYVSTGTIKNLDITNVKIGSHDERMETQNVYRIGILAGHVTNPQAIIENISINQAEIFVTSNSTYQLYVGGLVGDLRSVAKNITQNNVEIDVLTTSYAKVSVGGIAGLIGDKGGLRQVNSNAEINLEVKGDYVDISQKTWNISVGGTVGDLNSSLSRALQDVFHVGNIDVNLDFGTPSGQKGTYNVYVGGLTGQSYSQIYQAYYQGSINFNHTTNEFETNIIKSFYVGGISGYYGSNNPIDRALFSNTSNGININASEESKFYLSYTLGFNLAGLEHEISYYGNGLLTKNGNEYDELKPSIQIDTMDGYFTSDFMINLLIN